MRRSLAWIIPLLALAFFVLRAFGLERGYPLVPLVAYTPWLAPVALLAALLAFALRVRSAALCALLICVATAGLIAPRLTGGASDAAGGGGVALRVMALNTYWSAVDVDDLVDVVRSERIDLLTVQEIDAAMLARIDAAGMRELLPERVEALGNGKRSTAIYARGPLTARDRIAGTYKAMARAELAVAGVGAVDVVAVHTAAPNRSGRIDVWSDDLRALPAAPTTGPPRLLVGDFNATLDHAEFRRLLDRGYRDAAAATGAGLSTTWPVWLPGPKVAIDHVLADRRVGIRDFAVREVADSDHRAVIAELRLPRGRG